MSGPGESRARTAALRVGVWAPSPWAIMVLALWWSWRWAAQPAAHLDAGLAMVAGYAHDALVLYGVFGLLRYRCWRVAAERLSPAPRWIVVTCFALSALCRALDALQVRLTDARISPKLFEVLAADPLAELWGLRGLVAAVLISVGVVAWSLRRDERLSLAMRRRAAGARLDIVAGASLLIGCTLVLGGSDEGVSVAPERATVLALAQWLRW